MMRGSDWKIGCVIISQVPSGEYKIAQILDMTNPEFKPNGLLITSSYRPRKQFAVICDGLDDGIYVMAGCHHSGPPGIMLPEAIPLHIMLNDGEVGWAICHPAGSVEESMVKEILATI